MNGVLQFGMYLLGNGPVCFSNLPNSLEYECCMAGVILQFSASWSSIQFRVKQVRHSAAVIFNNFSAHLEMHCSISISRFM